MGLTPRLEVRQSQSLTLTPQLMQSIRLLQLSHLELNAFVEAELLRNPLLEREEGGAAEDGGIVAEATGADRFEASEPGGPLPSAEGIAASYDTEVENVFPEQPGQDRLEAPAYGERGGSGMGGDGDIERYVAQRPSLGDHLMQQAGLLLNAVNDRIIAASLIASLNECGYLASELEAIATQLGTEVRDVERVLKRLQGIEPLGVFARDLKECLAIQLGERNRLDPMMARLLEHLELIAAHDLPALLRAVGCDREDLADMLREIRALDPRPGLSFEGTPVETAVPDVFVRPAPDGSWAVELNSEVLPRVLVDRSYYATVNSKTRDPREREFLVDCLQSASWLAKSLDQRAQTILKVASEIVRQQEEFLREGITRLRPMTLKLVADAIDMHESTVSRVTSNKYVATPRGLFEMKYFFTTALGSSDGGEEHSAETVRHRIRQLVERESASDILSDDTIAELLHKEQGIEVARRTVAKYREGMNIPSSVIRRRQKRALVAAR